MRAFSLTVFDRCIRIKFRSQSHFFFSLLCVASFEACFISAFLSFFVLSVFLVLKPKNKLEIQFELRFCNSNRRDAEKLIFSGAIVMPFPMKIQPIDSHTYEEPARLEPVKPVVKWRFKRLFERQFQSVLRTSAAEKAGAAVAAAEEAHFGKDGSNDSAEFEPSSVCLDKMVQNFIEENNEKHSGAVRCGRNCCNCFNRTCNDSSDDESDSYGGPGDSNYYFCSVEASETLKSLVLCASVHERNLLAETAKIVEKNKICKRKDDFCRKVVTDGLLALGYDASICKSRWEKSVTYPAGEYEYIDVVIEGERLLVDIDFRSEFEIARSTKSYKSVLNTLPYIFVGKADRLQKVISVVSDAAKQSLKKKGMHVPPWRKAEYVKAKWLSPFKRLTPSPDEQPFPAVPGETKPRGADKISVEESVFAPAESPPEEEKGAWKPPEVLPRSLKIGVEIVSGLASVIDNEP